MLVFGRDAEVARWVAGHIPHMQGGDFGPCSAIGVVRGGALVAGIVYHDYQRGYETLQLSMAATSPRWASAGVLRGLLHYPFMQLGVNKLWTATPHTNERAIRFNKGVGFRQEGILRSHFGRGHHAVICGMLRVEYQRRWGVERVKEAA